MDDYYCGADKLKSGKTYGSIDICKKKKQVKYFGLMKIKNVNSKPSVINSWDDKKLTLRQRLGLLNASINTVKKIINNLEKEIKDGQDRINNKIAIDKNKKLVNINLKTLEEKNEKLKTYEYQFNVLKDEYNQSKLSVAGALDPKVEYLLNEIEKLDKMNVEQLKNYMKGNKIIIKGVSKLNKRDLLYEIKRAVEHPTTSEDKNKNEDDKINCGINELTQGQTRGSMVECLESNNVRLYGKYQIDRRLFLNHLINKYSRQFRQLKTLKMLDYQFDLKKVKGKINKLVNNDVNDIVNNKIDLEIKKKDIMIKKLDNDIDDAYDDIEKIDLEIKKDDLIIKKDDLKIKKIESKLKSFNIPNVEIYNKLDDYIKQVNMIDEEIKKIDNEIVKVKTKVKKNNLINQKDNLLSKKIDIIKPFYKIQNSDIDIDKIDSMINEVNLIDYEMKFIDKIIKSSNISIDEKDNFKNYKTVLQVDKDNLIKNFKIPKLNINVQKFDDLINQMKIIDDDKKKVIKSQIKNINKIVDDVKPDKKIDLLIKKDKLLIQKNNIDNDNDNDEALLLLQKEEKKILDKIDNIKNKYSVNSAVKLSKGIVKNLYDFLKTVDYDEKSKTFQRFIMNSNIRLKDLKKGTLNIEDLQNQLKDLQKKDVLSGDGLFDYFIDQDKLKGSSQKVLNEFGNYPIVKLSVYRTPVHSMLKNLLNIISLGQFNKASQSFDKLYHLALIIQVKLNDGSLKNIVVEKNATINISGDYKTSDKTEVLEIDLLNKNLTLNEMMSKALNAVGNKTFYLYDAFNRGEATNCQKFISILLENSNLMNDKTNQFINQDVQSIVKNMGSISGRVVPSVSRFLTDVGAVFGASKDNAGYALHAVLVKKPISNEELKKIHNEFIKDKNKTFFRETKSSYRLRNIPKQKFDKSTFRTKKINNNISLIFGQLK